MSEPLSTAPRRVADVIVDTLRELGVTTYYGIPGGAISPIYDALIDAPDTHLVTTRHETGAVFMAAGQAVSGGPLACVLMTSGPGVTNAMTGLASAKADGVPLIAIAGEVPHTNFGRGALQEGSIHGLDTVGMVRSVTKYAASIVNPKSASNVVRRAVATARSGRQGPVFLSLPIDVAQTEVVSTRVSADVATGFAFDAALLDEVVTLLRGARRGFILVGSGARHPEAVANVRALAEALALPVATTPKAKGLFPESHPLALGVFGYAGHPSAHAYAASDVDVVLAVGCGFGETSTNSWRAPLAPNAVFAQIDIDGSQIGKNYHVDYGLVGPAHQVLAQLLARVVPRPQDAPPPPAGGVDRLPYAPRPERPLHPARVVTRLQAVLPPDAMFTVDIGEHLLFALHYLVIDRPDTFFGALGLGSMGSGIGAAVGVALAHPGRRVVSLSGDYGFQMYGVELATCVEQRLPVVFVIFNDSRMRMVENGQRTVYGRGNIAGGPPVDFAALARAHGAQGLLVRTEDDFDALPEVLAGLDGPLVVDVRTDPEVAFGVNARSDAIRHFGTPQEED